MLKKLQKYILLATVFVLPLILNPFCYDMYAVPKNTVFKLSIATLGILFLLEKISNKKSHFRLSTKQIQAILVFLSVLALSIIFAIRPEVSFWGAFSRQGGVINMLFYVLLFLLSIQILRKKKDQILLLKTISYSGLLVSIYAIIQQLGLDIFSSESTDLFAGRSFASMGNPTMLGAFLLFPIWSEIYLFIKEKKHRKKHAAITLILTIALLCTKNRASILALMATGFLFLLEKFKSNKKVLIGLIASGLIALIAFIGIYGSDMRSIQSRINIWESSAQIIMDSPITGYGAESFSYLFESYVQPEFFQFEDYYNLVDRPHNEFLEMWIHFGLLGLLFYVGIIFWLLKTVFTEKKQLPKFTALAILALFASNFFSFSMVTHYMLLSIFLGVIASKNAKKITLHNSTKTKLIALLAIFVLAFSMLINTKIALANKSLKDAYTALNTFDSEETYYQLSRASHLAPFFEAIHTEKFTLAYAISSTITDESFKAMATTANERAKEISHYALKPMLNEARLLRLDSDFEAAETLYQTIETEISTHPLLYQHWGEMYYELQLFEQAANIYDQLFQLVPDDWQAPILSNGEMTEEQRIFWKNHPDFLEVLYQAIESYKSSDQTEKATELINAIT